MALPMIAAGLMGAFAAGAIKGIIARVLGALGFGYINYMGVTYLLNQMIATVHNQIGGIPSNLLHLVGMAGFDVAFSVILSAQFGWITFLAAHKGWRRIGMLAQGA